MNIAQTHQAISQRINEIQKELVPDLTKLAAGEPVTGCKSFHLERQDTGVVNAGFVNRVVVVTETETREITYMVNRLPAVGIDTYVKIEANVYPNGSAPHRFPTVAYLDTTDARSAKARDDFLTNVLLHGDRYSGAEEREACMRAGPTAQQTAASKQLPSTSKGEK